MCRVYSISTWCVENAGEVRIKKAKSRAPPNICIVQFILTHPFIFTLFIFWIYGLHSGVSQVSALLGGENSDIE